VRMGRLMDNPATAFGVIILGEFCIFALIFVAGFFYNRRHPHDDYRCEFCKHHNVSCNLSCTT
jgi:hypothetical protein